MPNMRLKKNDMPAQDPNVAQQKLSGSRAGLYR